MHHDPVIVHLTIDGELIETTPEHHPFYTIAEEWIPAGELQAGDLVRQADGSYGMVEATTFVYQPQPMYNLTVAAAHTYFVGEGQWLVHNCGVIIESGKFDYLFGRATGRPHNIARSNQNALQMSRLGVPDNEQGYRLLRDHLEQVVQTPDNVIKVFETKHGFFEVRESLFAGPSGAFAKFESTWEILSDGTRRLTTIIPFGG